MRAVVYPGGRMIDAKPLFAVGIAMLVLVSATGMAGAGECGHSPCEKNPAAHYGAGTAKMLLAQSAAERGTLQLAVNSTGEEDRRQLQELLAVLDLSLSYLQNSYDADEPMDAFKGDRLEAKLDLNGSPWVGHQVLMGVSYADSNIDDAAQLGPAGTSPVRLSDIDRHNYSLGLQDQVALNERISLTLGVRFDHYDDVGSLMTPRIAAVYRLGEHHVVKAQYSEGFRAPTFWELYGTGTADEGLDFEVMDTTELSYIYRRTNAVGRMTLYYSEIDDGIFRKSGGGYGNSVDIDSKGAELEWEQKLGQMLRWQANLSYNDTWDGRYAPGGDESPGIAAWLGNLALFVQPAAKLMLAGRLLHVGDRYTTDSRVPGYDTVDLSVSRTDLWKAGLTLRVGVKNVFDDPLSI